MASSTQCTQFKLMLIRVATLLTETNVKDLAFLCNDIRPARAATLTNARDLFSELQGHGLLNDRDVDVLINWLEELRLNEASKHVKEYRKKYLDCTPQECDRCIEHEDHRLKYFCLSCDRQVCAECIIKLHDRSTRCDVVEIAGVPNRICALREEGKTQLQVLKGNCETTKNLWTDKKEFLFKCREKVRKEIQSDYLATQEKLDKHKRSLIKNLDEKELSDLKTLMSEREKIERLSNNLESLTIDVNASSINSLNELRRINAVLKQIQKIKDKIEEQEKKVNQKTVDFSYRKIANDGLFGLTVSCSLVGGVELQKKQLLHLYDERQLNGGVRLICIDPKDPTNEYWRHLVPTGDKISPIVMSCINLYYHNIQHVVFATGKTVYIIHPHWTGFIHDSVETISSFLIDKIDEGSWITSIAAHHPSNDQYDELLITVSYSTLIREYRVTGEPLRQIETKDRIPSVRFVAYVNDLFAVSGLGCKDVILLKVNDGGALKQSGILKPPPSSTNLFPACLIWPGYTWLILFVDTTQENIWKVAHYQKTGEFIKVCAEGTICCDTDIPVSITRWENEGFVSFADDSVKNFTY